MHGDVSPTKSDRPTRSNEDPTMDSDDGMELRWRIDTVIPAAPPTRAPKPNCIPSRTQIAAGLRTHGRSAWIGRFLMHAASRFDNGHRVSAIGMVRSHSPLRGSSGFAPDSLLAQHYVSGAAIGHKIWCFLAPVNGQASRRNLRENHGGMRPQADVNKGHQFTHTGSTRSPSPRHRQSC